MPLLSTDEANQLWERYRSDGAPAGTAALDQLYRALRTPLFAFCRVKCGDPELADEIAEQAFVRLMIRKPRARRGIIPLLHKTAFNLIRDAWRTRSIPIGHTAEAPPSPTVDPERAEDVEAVRDCLTALPPEDRLFIAYVDMYGLTQGSACHLLGWRIAASTAHRRYRRIRAQLRACLEKKNIL